jgi:hypothetical protein
MRLTKQEVFWKAVKPGANTYGDSYYTRPTGIEKMCRRYVETKNDLLDSFEFGFSSDNGRNWSALQERKVFEPLPGGGAVRRHILPGFLDPVNGRMLTMLNEGVFPNDDALKDGMTNTYLRYRVSLDGGRTNAVDEMVVQNGFTAEQPMRGVTVGRNAVMLGDTGSETTRTGSGRLLVPVQVCPIGENGKYFNPGGGYTYHEAAVLIGRWEDEVVVAAVPGGSPAQDSQAERPRTGATTTRPLAHARGCRITWELSPYITNDPQKSTRGAVEPTIAQFPDGRVLMVLRGSNDVKPHLPGYRWFTVSHDEGDTWEDVRPWTYTDGGPFFSPSSMSQLLRHSNGATYWLGNLTPEYPKGNGPPYPLVIARVNPDSLMLERDSVFVVDTRREGEHPGMTLSNFHAHEDRVTGEIVLHLSRWRTRGPEDWTADALQYRIAVE